MLRTRLPTAFLCAALMLTGCASKQGKQAAASAPLPDWRSIVTDHDRTRLREWRKAWTEALRKAQTAGHSGEITREGALLHPDAALGWQNPPAGTFRCRVIKVGAKSKGLLDYVSYPAFSCRIRPEDGTMSFAKLTGSQRPIGLLFPHGTTPRMVFLGTLQLGDEQRALQYGLDRERDLAGYLERVGERRWRLILPYPHFESTLDVMELVPAA